MKKLVCEMCGSSDLVKQDGMFVCQTCGVKYSVEEAKKMMIEGTVDVSGSTVKVDNSSLIDNYFEIAKSAYESGNQKEAELYCNKIIEIEPSNHNAWLLKGKAAGWQSTIANSRVSEAVLAFSKAISFSPEDEKEKIIDDTKNEFSNLAISMLKLRGDRFEKWPDEEEASGLIVELTSIINNIAIFTDKIGNSVSISDIFESAADIIQLSVTNAYTQKIIPDYKNHGYDLPSDNDYAKLIERSDLCISLLEQAINLCKENESLNLGRYESLEIIQNFVMNNYGYDYAFWNYGSDQFQINRMINAIKKDGNIPDSRHDRYWWKSSSLSDFALAQRKQLVSQYKSKISSIKDKKS